MPIDPKLVLGILVCLLMVVGLGRYFVKTPKLRNVFSVILVVFAMMAMFFFSFSASSIAHHHQTQAAAPPKP